jgi:hypothetical protein
VAKSQTINDVESQADSQRTGMKKASGDSSAETSSNLFRDEDWLAYQKGMYGRAVSCSTWGFFSFVASGLSDCIGDEDALLLTSGLWISSSLCISFSATCFLEAFFGSSLTLRLPSNRVDVNAKGATGKVITFFVACLFVGWFVGVSRGYFPAIHLISSVTPGGTSGAGVP